MADLVSAPAPKIDIGKISGEILKGAGDFYTLKTQLDTAKYNQKIAKAGLQNQLYATRAGGQAVTSATMNLPSPALLLVGGLGLAALLILRR